MALEASDLNDGTILQQTKQNTDMRGNIQFEIKLPSGRTLTSEFINKDNARKALFAWIETVKEQAVADSNAERLERAAKARRGKMDIERKPGDDQPLFRAGGARTEDPKPHVPDYVDQQQTPFSDSPAMQAAEVLIKDLEQTRVPTETIQPGPMTLVPAQHTAEVDPLEFAQKQLQIYRERVAALKDAERKLWQWSTIVETLEEKESGIS